jgi:hypothetical protein
MHPPDWFRSARGDSRLWASWLWVVLGVLLCATAHAQEREPLSLLIRNTVPDSGGTLHITVMNRGDEDRPVRVVVFYREQPDVQYGRDVWAPAHATISTWVNLGAAPEATPPEGHKILFQLHDQSGGTDRLVIPPGELRNRAMPSPARKRKATTGMMIDGSPEASGASLGALPRVNEAYHLARLFRLASELSDEIRDLPTGPLLPTAEAFAGIDHLILASGRLADDPAGMKALRRWLEGGGRVWVMLDLVEPDMLGPLLGDAFDFQVVDRVGLTTFKVESQPPALGDQQEFEWPVELVRVLLPPNERPRHMVNGWPAWFTRTVGRGKVVFTTMGPRAWYRPRIPRKPGEQRGDLPSPFELYPNIAVPLKHLEMVAEELQPPKDDTLRAETFLPVLSPDIGYSVVGRGLVAVVFGAFLLAALALGIALKRWPRPELLGWLGPLAAIGATAAFVTLGVSSRRAAAPTVAVIQVIDAIPDADEAVVHGLFAMYRPDSGPANVGAAEGGVFDLDMVGLEGQVRRRILTDMDTWTWENLAMPAGVRCASFRYTSAIGEPIAAVARFGPEGLEGKLTAGPFHGLSDAIVNTASGRNMAIRLRPDGSFAAGSADLLSEGQFIGGTVLTDRQQRRQEMYRQFLKRAEINPQESRVDLLAWAEPIDMPFTLAPDAWMTGNALLIAPLRLEHPTPGERVTIPAPLLPCRRIRDSGPTRMPPESDLPIEMHLRFQLPTEALPFRVERARLTAKIDAPFRRITVAGRAGKELVELHRVDSPLDPIRMEITEERFLRIEDGGLHVNFSVSAPLNAAGAGRANVRANEKWTLSYVELEVVGRAE